MIIKINLQNPQERLLRKAVETLTDGGLIAYPTDTCYAIGCDLYNLKGIARIYHIKRRPTNKPFSFICEDLKNISEYALVGNYAYKVMKRLLPGPYTFVLEASRQVPRSSRPGGARWASGCRTTPSPWDWCISWDTPSSAPAPLSPKGRWRAILTKSKRGSSPTWLW